jgi:hypothetical protein
MNKSKELPPGLKKNNFTKEILTLIQVNFI